VIILTENNSKPHFISRKTRYGKKGFYIVTFSILVVGQILNIIAGTIYGGAENWTQDEGIINSIVFFASTFLVFALIEIISHLSYRLFVDLEQSEIIKKEEKEVWF